MQEEPAAPTLPSVREFLGLSRREADPEAAHLVEGVPSSSQRDLDSIFDKMDSPQAQVRSVYTILWIFEVALGDGNYVLVVMMGRGGGEGGVAGYRLYVQFVVDCLPNLCVFLPMVVCRRS